MTSIYTNTVVKNAAIAAYAQHEAGSAINLATFADAVARLIIAQKNDAFCHVRGTAFFKIIEDGPIYWRMFILANLGQELAERIMDNGGYYNSPWPNGAWRAKRTRRVCFPDGSYDEEYTWRIVPYDRKKKKIVIITISDTISIPRFQNRYTPRDPLIEINRPSTLVEWKTID